MSKSDEAIREFAEKYGMTFKRHVPFSEPESHEQETVIKKDFLSDLTALISEHYIAKEATGYPLEFIEWLIKDQEIFFGELNEEYILNDNIHVDGRKLQTIDELFNYWVNNKK